MSALEVEMEILSFSYWCCMLTPPAAPVPAGTMASTPSCKPSESPLFPWGCCDRRPLLSFSFTLIWIEGGNPSSREVCCGLTFTTTPCQELLLNSTGPSNELESFTWWDRKNSVLVLLFPHFPLLLAFQDKSSGTKPCNTATPKWPPVWHASLTSASTGTLSVMSQKVQFLHSIYKNFHKASRGPYRWENGN